MAHCSLMKKTFHLDEKLLLEAKKACGASTYTETVQLGLKALVRRAAINRLISLVGSEPDADLEEVPRRREKPAGKKRRRVA